MLLADLCTFDLLSGTLPETYFRTYFDILDFYFSLGPGCFLRSENRVFLNLWFAKPMVCVRVAFHENDGNHENDENDEDNADS